MENLLETLDLISNNYREDQFAVPAIRAIHDIREFMDDPNNFDGDINVLVDRLDSEFKQCQCIVYLLTEELKQNKISLDNVKRDLLALQAQLKLPDANQRFVVEQKKIPIQFPNKLEITECDVPTALDHYCLMMTTLYGKILAIHADIDFVIYLQNTALINRDSVAEWYEKIGKVIYEKKEDSI